jgi:acyl transferase domain-containing protein
MQTDNVLQDAVSLMKQSLQQLQAYRDSEYQQQEPLAIVGMAGRFPGNGADINAFWQMLLNGEETIGEIPPERWDVDEYYDPDPEAVGKIYTRCGSFMKDIDLFDAAFFGITPLEAFTMDPQQRLLLELCWRAFENAGYLPRAEPDTGVFVGVCTAEYIIKLAQIPMDEMDKKAIPYFSTGNVFNALSGRLSYVFGFQGPCVAMDTACSSSLVALHLACNAIRRGECKQAVVGGVNLQLVPESTMAISQARMLAPDGRCKTFDASANGYVRGEGSAIIVIKRLSDAIRNNDRIHAVIRGSAVNQDGGGSGFTVPSSKAQEKLMRKALASAGVSPAQVDYVEAHGTGTSLGDPIELSAVQAVYGAAPGRQHPLWVASVKTNIGHLEAAAGITGVIKTTLSLKHKMMPAHLHLQEPNPRIPWSRYNIRIPLQNQSWPLVNRPERAAVSAFGFSGTNAHVILEAAPAPVEEKQGSATTAPQLFTLSARSWQALTQYADQYIAFLEQAPAASLDVFCKAVQRLNPLMRYRASFVVPSASALLSQLRAYRQQELPSQEPANGREQYAVTLLCSAAGDHHWPVYRELYATQPVYARLADQYADFLKKNKGIDILRISGITGDEAAPATQQAPWVQAASGFVLNYALVALLKEWNVHPDCVVSAPGGEYLAACVAGVMEAEDALRLIIAKGDSLPDASFEMFRNVLSCITLHTPVLPFFSAVKGGELKQDAAGTDHWIAEAAGTARLDAALEAFNKTALQKIGIGLGDGALPSVVQHHITDRISLLQTLGALYNAGFELNWQAIYENTPSAVIEGLPGYPFQLKRYWPDASEKNRLFRFSRQQTLEYLYGAASWTEQQRHTINTVVNMLYEQEQSNKPPALEYQSISTSAH